MCKFKTTVAMAKTSLNLARDIFSQVQNVESCEYYDRNAPTAGLVKCQHSKNKKVLEPKDGKPERILRLPCSLTNCPFVTGK